MPLEGRRLTGVEVAELCFKAGWWRTKRLITAVAICDAESRFYTRAWNENEDGSIDRGIAQINSRAHPGVTEQCAWDPECNVEQAYAIYKGRGYQFTAWAAYTNGGYLFSLPLAIEAVCQFLAARKLPVRA